MTVDAGFGVAPLLNLSDLAVWAREAIPPEDPWALAVIDAASWLVRNTAGFPLWTATDAPPRARQIASHVAARSYKNPDSVVTEGALGPLGGDRTVEELARALHLTDGERAELEAMRPEATGPSSGDLWIQPTGLDDSVASLDAYLSDTGGSDWLIPYLHEDDIQALG